MALLRERDCVWCVSKSRIGNEKLSLRQLSGCGWF